MNNKSPLSGFLSIIMLCLCSGLAMAAENALEESVDFSEEALLELRDPFASQLPPKVIKSSETLTKPVVAQSSPKGTPTPTPTGVVSKHDGSENPIDNAAFSKNPLPKIQPRLELTGIIFDTVKPKAIINGTVLGIGDRIESAVVKSIRKGLVEIQFEGGIISLRMD